MANKDSRLVYSTDAGRIYQSDAPQIVETDGTVRIRLETNDEIRW